VSVSLADHWVDCVSVSDSRVCSSWLLLRWLAGKMEQHRCEQPP